MNHLEKDLKTFKEIARLHREIRDHGMFDKSEVNSVSVAKDIVLNRKLGHRIEGAIGKMKSEYIG